MFSAVLLGACSAQSGSSDAGADAGTDAGVADAGPRWSAPVTVDPSPDAGFELTFALDKEGKPAIAYFRDDAANQASLILARETSAGIWSRETVPAGRDGGPLAAHYGLGLGFDPEGYPALAYLGGATRDSKSPPDERWHDFLTGVALPSDSVMARKSAAGWSLTTLGNASDSYAHTGFALDDQGGIVGLWSSVAFSADGTAHVVQRDVHFAAAEADTDDSNLEYGQFGVHGLIAGEAVPSRVSGAPPPCAWPVSTESPAPACYVHGGGTYSHLILVNDQPAVAFAQATDTINDANGAWFARRTGPASWSRAQVSATQGRAGHGPSLAYSPSSGFAMGILDAAGGDLLVATSSDGLAWDVNTVEALGETGYHPQVAFGARGLGVLYGYCRGPTDAPSGCNPAIEELRFRLPGSAGPTGAWSSPEAVDNAVPDAAVLIADGEGNYLAVWRDPVLGVRASRRSP